MARKPRIYLPFDNWPAEDQARWQAAFKVGDRFEESGSGSHLAEATRRNLFLSYARLLGFVSAHCKNLLQLNPEARIDRPLVIQYVTCRRRSCGDGMVAVDLYGIRGALKLICPGVDWSWLLAVAKRLAAAAPRKPKKYHLVTSERLYALGIELMDRAVAEADSANCITRAHALEYRDGLIIAMVALIPLRRRTLVALRIGTQLVKPVIFGHSTSLHATLRHGERSITRSQRSYARALICTWHGSEATFLVLARTAPFGRPTNEDPCPPLVSARPSANALRELSDFL